MSPAALKYEVALDFPTIASSVLYDTKAIGISGTPNLTIAHQGKPTLGHMKDWMLFTHDLGNGIFENI